MPYKKQTKVCAIYGDGATGESTLPKTFANKINTEFSLRKNIELSLFFGTRGSRLLKKKSTKKMLKRNINTITWESEITIKFSLLFGICKYWPSKMTVKKTLKGRISTITWIARTVQRWHQNNLPFFFFIQCKWLWVANNLQRYQTID